jgi:hypothetical protein
MGYARIDQSTFTQGQIDPRVQSRVDWESYYKAAKQITNGLVIPQGGVQNRWGSVYVDRVNIAVPADFQYAEISTLIYNDNLIYLLLWTATSLFIYLENQYITGNAPIGTQYNKEDIPTLRFSQVQTRVIITTGNFQPQQLVRSADAPAAITAFSAGNSTLTAVLPYAAGLVLPVQFTITGVGALPTTNPQIYVGRDYFILMTAANTFKVFSTSGDAINNTNYYSITNAGVNANVVVQNTWTISNIVFKNLPTYDFNGGYTAINFTPSAVSGNAVTITASAPIFTAAEVGGLFEGNGGILRITNFTDNMHVIGFTIEPFANTNAIPGLLSFIGEPAWSATRGWPHVSSFFQNRLVFANTVSLPSGQWLSVINDVFNFDDSQTLADDAISSYPESGTMSVIQSMTSGRSMVVHTNTGNYSSPVQTEIVVTPTSYLLTEQNKFGVGQLQPVFIDNQIFFVDRSGNNVINMMWEFTQSSYVTDSVSVKSSNLLINPVDMTTFFEPQFIDGFFVLFVNSNGSMAVLQTLSEQNISAFTGNLTFTNQVIDQNNNAITVPSFYLKVNSAQNRCWFLVTRIIEIAQAGTAITGFAGAPVNTLRALGHGMVIGQPTLISFTTVGALPQTIPPINTTQYFWANATTANDFQVFSNVNDATINPPDKPTVTNPFTIINAGNNSDVVPWLPTSQLFIEEINFNYYTDSTTNLASPNLTTVVMGLGHLNGQVVQVVADGYVLNNQTVFDGQITIEQPSFNISVGLPFTTVLIPLPPAIPGTPGSLYQPRHIRNLYINYYNTIGATIQGYGIPVTQLQNVVIGGVPTPQTGVFEYTLMEGWDGATPVDIQIIQSSPLPMTIIGLSYILEI